ncbi:hypothetical protein HanHA300_Chr00c0598g0788611 [Helianthus annuus]|nr:hypothetical protein HanHA300_Chr00c0598g0788611 [Helianthus annuus]
MDEGFVGTKSDSVSAFVFSLLSIVRSRNRLMKRLVMLISLNVGCSTAELVIGLLSGQACTCLVSDAFHLTFGCGLLTFSLFGCGGSWMVMLGFQWDGGVGGSGMVVVGMMRWWWCGDGGWW